MRRTAEDRQRVLVDAPLVGRDDRTHPNRQGAHQRCHRERDQEARADDHRVRHVERQHRTSPPAGSHRLDDVVDLLPIRRDRVPVGGALGVANRGVAHLVPARGGVEHGVGDGIGIRGGDGDRRLHAIGGLDEPTRAGGDDRARRERALHRGVAEGLVEPGGHQQDVGGGEVGPDVGLEAEQANPLRRAGPRDAGAEVVLDPLVAREDVADDVERCQRPRSSRIPTASTASRTPFRSDRRPT